MINHHGTAVIHSATRLDESVVVGPYAVIEDGVEIGARTVIGAHAVIRTGTIIGKKCHIDSHTVIGGLPQDHSFHPATPSGVQIGDQVTIREGVTISRATAPGGFTVVGNHVYLMANSHIGHDCRVGNHVTMANGVLLAGRVQVGDHCFLGGGAAVHQFIRIGESVMIGGLSRVSQDAPTYCMVAERNELIGLNLVGLQRRGFSRETIKGIKRLYHLIFSIQGNPRRLAEAALIDGLAKSEEEVQFLSFIAAESKKGIMRAEPDKTKE